MPARFVPPARVVLPALAGMQVALFAYYVHVNLVLQPYWDMLSHVTRYLRFRDQDGWWAYLWDPHVQHRHVWMRLLTAADVEGLSGTGYPYVASAVAAQLVAGWLLGRATVRRAPPGLRAAAGSLVVMLVLTSVASAVCA
ncbi:MAG: hypothetical protein FJW23_16055, partial [Acidimicrobiia bacterium]|nr:hypothetical protein [Acidimicrobiia bacterium]